ncbi:hypothetical protein E2C06_29530 [Dankookia rubra]|uniref:Uncharacterized protein n=1 Tax=Dankookia rubra TaxID=1442381 RepID=A0A4R5Q9L9_9PROT|nr:hypothetical protein [Dankookia rubra]TDH59031.1 hypothetical protein E2C06_29530 [Dankookia rubra]
MRTLDQARLVGAKRQGRSPIHAVRVAQPRGLLAVLTDARCGDLGPYLNPALPVNGARPPLPFALRFSSGPAIPAARA